MWSLLISETFGDGLNDVHSQRAAFQGLDDLQRRDTDRETMINEGVRQLASV